MLKSQHCHDSIILVVDDEPSALEFLSVLLREAGFERVLTACSVAEAIRRLDSLRPDLVLLDWHLGADDSANVIRHLRMTHADEIIPVIVLTADLAPAGCVHACSKWQTSVPPAGRGKGASLSLVFANYGYAVGISAS